MELAVVDCAYVLSGSVKMHMVLFIGADVVNWDVNSIAHRYKYRRGVRILVSKSYYWVLPS